MRVLRFCCVLLFALVPAHVGTASAYGADGRCDATCVNEQVTWYLASQQTLARMWFGAVISVQPAAQCVAHHESHGSYVAENAISTASGKYQFLDGTWRNVTLAMGRPDLPAHASAAPSWDQEAAFWWAWTHIGSSPWAGTGCG